MAQQDWYKQPSITKELMTFHTNLAQVPPDNGVKEDSKVLIDNLCLYLKQNFNLCDRLEYTGSYYEKINICGEVTELDVMFVCKQKLCVKEENRGLCRVQPENDMFLYPQDDRGFVDPEKYRFFFRGKVEGWVNNKVNKISGYKKIRLIEHRVATQIDVLKRDGTLWYQVDLVPCFEIGGRLFVPKPINNAEDMWRHSFSREEKKEVAKLTGDTKMVCRIVKALFKLDPSGLSKIYTSYHIKTTALILCKGGWKPQKCQLGEAIYTFLCAVKKHLLNRNLPHQFQPGINLLEGVEDTIKYTQMGKSIGNYLKSDPAFRTQLVKYPTPPTSQMRGLSVNDRK